MVEIGIKLTTITHHNHFRNCSSTSIDLIGQKNISEVPISMIFCKIIIRIISIDCNAHYLIDIKIYIGFILISRVILRDVLNSSIYFYQIIRVANVNASVCSVKSFKKSGRANKRRSKASCWILSHLNGVSFLISLLKGLAIFEKFLGKFLTLSIFLGSNLTPSLLVICLKNSNSCFAFLRI